MLPKDAGGPGILQNPFLNHEGSAARQALLSGLEDELDGAFELPFQLIEDAGGAKQGGGVHVVATGVHYAWFLRLIRHLIGLFDRQSVNIRAKSYHVLCRVVSLDEAHNAIVGNAVLVAGWKGAFPMLGFLPPFWALSAAFVAGIAVSLAWPRHPAET